MREDEGVSLPQAGQEAELPSRMWQEVEDGKVQRTQILTKKYDHRQRSGEEAGGRRQGPGSRRVVEWWTKQSWLVWSRRWGREPGAGKSGIHTASSQGRGLLVHS